MFPKHHVLWIGASQEGKSRQHGVLLAHSFEFVNPGAARVTRGYQLDMTWPPLAGLPSAREIRTTLPP